VFSCHNRQQQRWYNNVTATMRTAYQLLISTLNCNSLPITPSLYYWFPLIAIFQAKLDQNIPQSALFLISSKREVLRISRNSVFLQITCPSFHSFTLTPFCAQTSLKYLSTRLLTPSGLPWHTHIILTGIYQMNLGQLDDHNFLAYILLGKTKNSYTP